MKKAKKEKAAPNAHTARTKYGMGDFYGTAIKQKVGRIRSSYAPGFIPATEKQLKTPPKNLA